MFRRNGRGRLLLLIFLALSVVVITLEFRQGENGPLERAKDLATTVVAPIQRGITNVARPIGNFFSSIGELGELRSRNAELEDELRALEARLREADAIEDENRELRDTLDLAESYKTMDTVSASVIARGPSNYRWTRLIDKGASDGIEPDMAVVAVDGLVGKVLSVEANSAVVLLLIDPEAAAAARTEGVRDTGLIQGDGAGQPLGFELVSPKADVDVGDSIVTSGYDRGIFPPGIPIGAVTYASGAGPELEQLIEVEPYVDFNKLDFLTVLLESGPYLELDEKRDVAEKESEEGRVGDG